MGALCSMVFLFTPWCYPFPEGFHIFNGFLVHPFFPDSFGALLLSHPNIPRVGPPVWEPTFPWSKIPTLPMQPDTTLACRCTKNQSLLGGLASQFHPNSWKISSNILRSWENPAQCFSNVGYPHVFTRHPCVLKRVRDTQHKNLDFTNFTHLDLPEIKREIPLGNSPYSFNQVRLKKIATLWLPRWNSLRFVLSVSISKSKNPPKLQGQEQPVACTHTLGKLEQHVFTRFSSTFKNCAAQGNKF